MIQTINSSQAHYTASATALLAIMVDKEVSRLTTTTPQKSKNNKQVGRFGLKYKRVLTTYVQDSSNAIKAALRVSKFWDR
jgi:hypothetical protein